MPDRYVLVLGWIEAKPQVFDEYEDAADFADMLRADGIDVQVCKLVPVPVTE